jgi:hypothetical protein
MAMKLGKAILHRTKTVAMGGDDKEKDKEKEKDKPESEAEVPNSPSSTSFKLRRGEEELLSPQQLQQYKALLKTYEVRIGLLGSCLYVPAPCNLISYFPTFNCFAASENLTMRLFQPDFGEIAASFPFVLIPLCNRNWNILKISMKTIQMLYRNILRRIKALCEAFVVFRSHFIHLSLEFQDADRLFAQVLKARSDDFKRSANETDNADFKLGSVSGVRACFSLSRMM